MTPLQQAYLQKLRATADANAAFFELNMPQHKMLLDEAPTASVDISDQGDLVIRYADGESRRITTDILEMEGRIEQFADLQDRPQILAFHNMRKFYENPSHGDHQVFHYSKLDAEYPNRATRHFAKHYPDNSGLNRYPSFGQKEIPLLIVFGSRLGWHLPRLLAEYKIRHLIVIETDVDAFRLSVFFQDYVLLSRLAMEQGTDLIFIVQSDVEKIARSMTAAMLKSEGLPQFFIHGASMFYALDDAEMVASIRTTIVDTLWELFFGMGYFDDELITIRHTFDNLRQRFPVFTRPNAIKPDAVAFIVGSGPSLDGLIPLLRQYGDRAVIFSCGTAISILHKMGIKPDFHIEKERQDIVTDILVKSISNDMEFLKGINFIGLSPVYSEVFRMFDRCGMIVKAADTMGALLEVDGMPSGVILSGQPTVTNTAIDYTLCAGFKNIYLFGVDMGSKDKEKHHSQHTVYVNLLPEEDHLKKLLAHQPSNDIVVPGNFGGEAHANKILAFARRMMGFMVGGYPDAKVYNLNDGAMIEHTIPLLPADFDERWAGGCDKRATVEAVMNTFEAGEFDLEVLQRILLERIDAFIAQVEAIVSEPQDSLSNVLDKMIAIHWMTLGPSNINDPCALVFRGTAARLLSMAYNAVTIIKDQDEALAKAEWDFANLVECLHEARGEVVKNIQIALATAEQ
ncbi:MAG TPA: 6-hydroxymethylpterin diphosphokinase MptE-like protein [Methylophilaceae bacterium]|nr:6-hydroxymethylpterin diphosphokinase MptE-like protein [Methylophilaceae bacterium]